MTLPDVPECDVALLPDGRLRVTHKVTRRSRLVVNNERAALLAGTGLSIAATLWGTETSFTTGDPAGDPA